MQRVLVFPALLIAYLYVSFHFPDTLHRYNNTKMSPDGGDNKGFVWFDCANESICIKDVRMRDTSPINPQMYTANDVRVPAMHPCVYRHHNPPSHLDPLGFMYADIDQIMAQMRHVQTTVAFHCETSIICSVNRYILHALGDRNC
eukprot:636933_1